MKKILIPTDFSDCAQNALRFAIEIAKNTKAKIMVFHAISETKDPIFTQECEFLPASEVKKTELRESLEKIKWEFPELRKLDYEFVLKHGDISVELHQAITDKSLDLILLGTKDNTDQQSLTPGNKAYEVIKAANCPVLTIPEKAKIGKINNIAFATDFEKLSNHGVLNTFKLFADAFKAKVHIVHVCQDIEEAISKAEAEEAEIEYYFETTEHTYNYVLNIDLEKGLSDYINKNKIDILAAIHKRPNSNDVNPSLVNKLSLFSEVPFLTVKEQVQTKQKVSV
jgi:nucleotide-binding universal stress UspA family protein